MYFLGYQSETEKLKIEENHLRKEIERMRNEFEELEPQVRMMEEINRE